MNDAERDAGDPRIALVFDESVRAMGQQQDALEELRTRAGLVLSAAAITSSLFGAQTLRDDALTCLSWAALAAFALTAGAVLYVLWPREWHFSTNVGTLLGVWVDEEKANVDTMKRDVAEFNQRAWDRNKWKLRRLNVWFRVASAALGVEVILWLIDLGTR